jgi:hypothetical protein
MGAESYLSSALCLPFALCPLIKIRIRIKQSTEVT